MQIPFVQEKKRIYSLTKSYQGFRHGKEVHLNKLIISSGVLLCNLLHTSQKMPKKKKERMCDVCEGNTDKEKEITKKR
jgi:hypothetical protein